MIFKNLERKGKITFGGMDKAYLGIGALAMSTGILLSLFSKKSPWSIVGGILLGISMVFNLAGIVSFGKARRIQKSQNLHS